MPTALIVLHPDPADHQQAEAVAALDRHIGQHAGDYARIVLAGRPGAPSPLTRPGTLTLDVPAWAGNAFDGTVRGTGLTLNEELTEAAVTHVEVAGDFDRTVSSTAGRARRLGYHVTVNWALTYGHTPEAAAALDAQLANLTPGGPTAEDFADTRAELGAHLTDPDAETGPPRP